MKVLGSRGGKAGGGKNLKAWRATKTKAELSEIGRAAVRARRGKSRARVVTAVAFDDDEEAIDAPFDDEEE